MAQLNKIRYADGRTVRPGEWTCSPLYSSIEINDGAISQLDAFSYGKGGDVPGSGSPPRIASLNDTNMEGQGSVLAENEQLLIFGLCIELFQLVSNATNFFTEQEAWTPDQPLVSATNVARVLQDTLIRMKIAATKDYLAVPIGFLPGSRGVYHTFGSARSLGSGYTEGIIVGYNGNVSEGDHRRFATPHEVAPGESFVVRFEFPRGSVQNLDFGTDTGATIAARVFTRGVRRRPVA